MAIVCRFFFCLRRYKRIVLVHCICINATTISITSHTYMFNKQKWSDMIRWLIKCDNGIFSAFLFKEISVTFWCVCTFMVCVVCYESMVAIFVVDLLFIKIHQSKLNCIIFLWFFVYFARDSVAAVPAKSAVCHPFYYVLALVRITRRLTWTLFIQNRDINNNKMLYRIIIYYQLDSVTGFQLDVDKWTKKKLLFVSKIVVS